MPEVKLSEDIRNEILDEASDYIKTPPGPNEVTARMFAEKKGISSRKARQILDRMVEEGVLEKRRNGRAPNGSKCNVYRKVTDDD